MKVIDINTGIYGDENLVMIYDLLNTARSLGYTHFNDEFNNEIEVPITTFLDAMDQFFATGELWSNLDEATKVDLGHVGMIDSSYPIKSDVTFRECTEREKAEMLNKGIPEFIISRVQYPQVTTYYREFSTFTSGGISVCFVFDVYQKVDIQTKKRVSKTRVFVN